MYAVKDVVAKRERIVHGIDKDATLPRAALEMHDHGIGALVVHDAGRVVGIFTWHDLIRAVASHGEELATRRVGDFMTTDMQTTTDEEAYADAERRMVQRHVRHLPIMSGDEVVGMIDMIDVLRRHIDDADALTEDLEAYIKGTYPH